MSKLPAQMMRHLPDSEVEIQTWSAVSHTLKLQIQKDIDPKEGTIQFLGVSLIHLAPRFTVSSLSCHENAVSNIPDIKPESNETIYVFEEAWGNTYYVVAESIKYEESV